MLVRFVYPQWHPPLGGWPSPGLIGWLGHQSPRDRPLRYRDGRYGTTIKFFWVEKFEGALFEHITEKHSWQARGYDVR